mgnify:CR=1 FL=1
MALLAEEARITGAELPVQTETDRKLDQGIRDMIKQLDVNIGKEGQVWSLKGDDITADCSSLRAIMGERQKYLVAEYNSELDLQRLKQDGRNLELAEFDKLAVKQVETYLKNLESLGLEREMVEQNFVAKMQAAGMEAQAAKDLFAITKERLEYQLTAEAKLKDMVEALITNINEGLGNAINKVFDNIAEGKSIKDGFMAKAGGAIGGVFGLLKKAALIGLLVMLPKILNSKEAKEFVKYMEDTGIPAIKNFFIGVKDFFLLFTEEGGTEIGRVSCRERV